MLEAIIIGIVTIILAMTTFIAGAYIVKLWYMLPERRMTAIERKLNKFLQILIVEDWYPED